MRICVKKNQMERGGEDLAEGLQQEDCVSWKEERENKTIFLLTLLDLCVYGGEYREKGREGEKERECTVDGDVNGPGQSEG